MERDIIIREIEEFCTRSGGAPSTLCLRAVNNPHLYERMLKGGSCTILTAERLRNYMANADIPDQIPDPSPTPTPVLINDDRGHA